MADGCHTCFVCGRPVEALPEFEKPGVLPLCVGSYEDEGQLVRPCHRAFERWNMRRDRLARDVAESAMKV